MKIFAFLLILCLIFIGFEGKSQTSYNIERLSVQKKYSKIIRDVEVDFELSIQNLESPFEGNSHYRHFLDDLKDESARLYPFRPTKNNRRISENTIDTPAVIKTFEGNKYNNSAPNDNTMAVSKDGILISAINTNIIFYDTKNDSLLKTISLSAFSDTLTNISTHQYDPKVIYDYQLDRFIIVNLAGASSETKTHIVVAFQATSDILGEWNFYALEGNPLNDTSWTDFPAISLTNDELFITGNLLRYGGSWQTSFKQSVIWQIDKKSGFNGDQTLNTALYSGIKFNDVNIRNLHPVMGGSGFFGPEMYFLSNKNFSIQSDTFFLLKTTGLLSNTNTKLEIKMLKSDKNYGAPPNPQSPGNKRLATNDARVLGAILENNVLQIVGNTIDTTNGYATIYHGLIQNPDGATEVKLTLIQIDSLQLGYPNISYCGTHDKSVQSIINFNFTNLTVNPGMACIFFQKEGYYSDIKILRKGDTYINVLLGGLQRWGDYSGSQPAYGETGKVWVNGTYGRSSGVFKIYGTWVAQLSSTTPDEPYINLPKNKAIIYPNPTPDNYVNIGFEMESNSFITIEVVDIKGNIMQLAQGYPVKQGANNLSFSTLPLMVGTYILRIRDSKSVLFSEKFIVVN
jgi:hypothetical protein